MSFIKKKVKCIVNENQIQLLEKLKRILIIFRRKVGTSASK